MKPGSIVALALTVVGLCAVVFAFVKNSSPYVTIAQARESGQSSVHLAGDIDKSSLVVGVDTTSFRLTDETGTTTLVVYEGGPPANMGDATKVVAIGSMQGDHFLAHKLLLKCPSKYETKVKPKL